MKKFIKYLTISIAGFAVLPIVLTACNATSNNQQGGINKPITPPDTKPPVDKPEWEKPPVDITKDTEYKQIVTTDYHFLNNLGIRSTWHKETIENDLVYQMDQLKDIYIKEFVRGFHQLTRDSLRYVTTMIRYIDHRFYAYVYFQALPGSIYKRDEINLKPIELQLQILLLKDNESIIG